MSAAFAEMPLAVFTTLGPVGAGAFIALAVALLAGGLIDEQVKRSDKWAIVPVVITCVGLVASVFHLGDAGHMFGVASGIGRSPLSNEICAAGIFFVVALVYAVMGLAGKLSGGSRKALGIAAGVLGLVFAVFTGLAYSIPTIPSWASPMNIVAMIGFALAGGSALLVVMTADGKSDGSSLAGILAVVGAVVAVIGVAGMAAATGSLSNAVVDGAALLSAAAPYVGGGLACIVASAVCTLLAGRKNSAGLAWLALALAVVGVFLSRLAFYGMQISVGISL